MKFLFIGVALVMISSLSLAQSVSGQYQITAFKTLQGGPSVPFVDKQMSFEGTDFNGQSFTKLQNTDSYGRAYLNLGYANYGVFCAKLDGPHYCFSLNNAVYNPYQVLNAREGGDRYECKANVTLPNQQFGQPGNINVNCFARY